MKRRKYFSEALREVSGGAEDLDLRDDRTREVSSTSLSLCFASLSHFTHLEPPPPILLCL